MSDIIWYSFIFLVGVAIGRYLIAPLIFHWLRK